MSIFQRALGCICTVFRSCDCSTSRSHLNPARSGKKSHKSLRVNSNCHVWWKRWTSMFQDFYQMYPMRLDDLCVLPLPESVLNSHNLQKCSGPRFQTLGVSMIFLIVEWTNSYLNNCFVSPKHVASCTCPVGTGDLFWVCCCSQHRERSESPLNVNWNKFYRERHTGKTTRKLTLSSMFIPWHLWRITFRRSG